MLLSSPADTSSPADSNAAILLIDDDPDARASLADNLTADGYEVLESGTRTAAHRLTSARLLDMVVIRCAPRDGHGLLAMAREADRRGVGDGELMVMIVCDEASELDTLRCYERGCDELVCGASYVELRVRIAAVLRRRTRTAARRLRVGPLVVDGLSRQAWVAGDPVFLSNKEFSLLQLLASDPAKVFTREEILHTVWGWDDPADALRSTRTLDSHASRLRRKLAVGDARFVINVWGVGYRLTELALARQLVSV